MMGTRVAEGALISIYTFAAAGVVRRRAVRQAASRPAARRVYVREGALWFIVCKCMLCFDNPVVLKYFFEYSRKHVGINIKNIRLLKPDSKRQEWFFNAGRQRGQGVGFLNGPHDGAVKVRIT